MKATKILAAAAVFSFATAGSALAFHSGGVAECEGCHTMHNTAGGSGKQVPLAKGTGQGAIFLLQGTDQSSTCMNCHNVADTAPSGYHIASDYGTTPAAGVAPVEMTPGGDFAWLKKTYVYSVRGTATTDDGHGHGHDINAVDYGYNGSNNTVAPGSTNNYPQANLACSSCHDPHGKTRRLADGTYATTGLPIFNSGSYNNSADPIAGVSAVGAYRILGGKGYLPKSLAVAGLTNLAFGANTNPPDAVVPSTYNRSEATAQTHVAYGQGMSEWCANCHDQMLENSYQSGAVNHRHPAGSNAKLTAAIVSNYNSYVSSGIMTNADPTKAYSTLAPFELGTGDRTVLKPLAINADTQNQSATTTSNVMCLSCHRAHASGFPDMARFNLENEFMTIADSTNAAAYDSSTTEGKINLGKTVAEQQAAYYGRPASTFGPYARDYCNKCHAKD